MITSRARRAVVSLAIVGGILVGGMMAGATPIYAQEDVAPPERTVGTGGVTFVTPPTTAPPPTTTTPPRVEAPTTTTIPSTPPTTVPPIPVPPATSTPSVEAPTTTLPSIPVPPAPTPATTVPPVITIPEDICERWPDLCTPVPDDRATAPGVAAPATDPAPVPAAPAPETPSDEVAGDAATNPHALRVVRHVQRTIRLVRLTVAIQRMEGDGPSTLSIDGGALREEIGVTCPDNDCFVDFYTWCWEMGGVIAEGEGEGGYVCKFYTPAVSPALDVTLNDLPRGQAGDPDDECIMTIQVCWEIDDVLECLPAKEINICEEEEPGSPEIPAPHPNPADVAVRDTETEVHDDAGMTCQAIACGFFLNWCDDMGGISETEHVGGGYHEVTCHLPNG